MNGFFDFVTVCRTLKVYHKRCGQFPLQFCIVMDKFTLRLFFLGVNRVKMDDLELEENQEKQAGG